VLSTKQDYAEILDGLGERWEAGLNTYKPFACGIVIHPTIDGCIQLREQLGEAVREIESVALRTHPLVLELTGKAAPKTGLEGKFSVFHAAATALLRGDGSPTAFTDEVVNDPEIVALRQKVKADTDRSIHEDQVELVVTLKGGRRVEKRVEHAIGSLDRPLSREELERKFVNQTAPILGEAAATRLLGEAWRLPELQDAAAIARLSVPEAVSRTAAHA
jgi:2-methylcitrate dehydratase PrpD